MAEHGGRPPDGLWGPARRRLTLGLVLSVTMVAFEALAVSTVMPTVEADLGDLWLYGWVFSGFFLASLIGIVAAGLVVDRRGLVLPFATGLVLFSAGLVAGGLAPSMPVLVAARVVQGLGAGAVPATLYAAIGRRYPAALRPAMFAVLSAAWVVPGLVGPAAATLIEHALSWRYVFLGLLPVVGVGAALALPALAARARAGPGDDGAADAAAAGQGAPPVLAGATATEAVSPDAVAGLSSAATMARVVVLVVGVGGVLATGGDVPVVLAVALVGAGLAAAGWALAGLLPPGTFRLAPGVPATVAVRGVLTCAFFAADAYVPLAVVEGRGAATWVAGASLTAVSITWTAGAWIQARTVERVGPRRLDRVGFAVLAVAVAGLVGVALTLPVGLAVPVWAVGGLGMGMAYAPLSVTVLAAAPAGEEGAASAALQLADTLGVAVGTGVGGWLVALGEQRGWSVADSTAVVFATALAVAVAGWAASGRLPRRVPTAAG